MERRRHRRFGLMLPAVVRHGASGMPVKGKLIDLSENGASITSATKPLATAGVYVHFWLQPDVHCEATGTIVRLLPLGPQWGIGVDFAYANSSLLIFLRNLEAAAEAIRPDILRDIRDLTITIE